MVLICGCNLSVDDLPLSDSIDYEIIPENSTLLCLKTKARQPACITVYLSADLKHYLKGQPTAVTNKTVIFDDDNDLINLINEANNIAPVSNSNKGYESVTNMFGATNSGGTEKAEPPIEDNKVSYIKSNNEPEVVKENKVTVVKENKVTVVKENNVTEAFNEPKVTDVTADDLIEDVDVSLPDTFNCEPYDDTDSLKLRLKSKEDQLNQVYAMLQSANDNAERNFSEWNELENSYKNKLKEAQNALETCKAKVAELQSSSGKYEIYGRHPNALLQEGFSSEEKSVINELGLNLQVMFNGTDIYRMYDTVKKTIEQSNEGYVFIDLVGDYILSRTYKVKDSSASLLLLNKMSNKDIERVKAGTVTVGNSQIVTCKPYHDIMLLDIDWGIALSNIKAMFPNRRVVILFGSIQSFAVEYTVSKFATLFKTTVFVKCSPFGINFVYGKMKFIPNSRGIKWMVSDYYDGSETLLQKVSKEYSVKSGDLMILDDMN